MPQHSLVATRLAMTLQHCSEACKPKYSCSMSFKGAKISWYRCERGVLFYYELIPSAIRHDNDDAFIIFRIAAVNNNHIIWHL